MTLLEKIENISKQVVEADNKLSLVIHQMFPIAIELEDYEGFCILQLWEKPLIPEKISNEVQLETAMKTLEQAGIKYERAIDIQKEALEKYLRLRVVDKNNYCCYSAKEMEDYFVRAEQILNATDVPKELSPVDLYYRSASASEQKITIINNRKDIEKQYAVLQNFITDKLTYYQVQATQKLEKKRVNNVIGSKKVFVIHGHNEAKKLELASLLKDDFGLEPVLLSEKPNNGMTIIEKFEKYAPECSYAFALFTPDDIVTSNNGDSYFQARPNVIFELGWFYSHLGRSRVCILDQKSEKSVIFSDLQGVMRIQFNQNIKEKFFEIQKELEFAGII